MTFRPGQSGNPKGRPRGVATQAKLRAAIAEDLPDIIAALVEGAKAGDTTAARLLLDRVFPALRPVDLPAPLPRGADLSDPTQGPAAILAGLAAGALTPEQAASYAATLAHIAKVREITELEERITALEQRPPQA